MDIPVFQQGLAQVKQADPQESYADIRGRLRLQIHGYALDADIQVKNNDYQQMAIKHYNNAVMDIHLTLTKRAADAK